MESPIRVLIADDDETYREVLLDSIKSDELKPEVASDGVEALEKLGKEPADILITDLHMPRMDGLTLLRRVREHYPHILTIIITGYGSLESAIEAIRLGAYDYVQKPFKSQEIAVTTRNAIEKVRMTRERAQLLSQLESLHKRLRAYDADGRKDVGEPVLDDREAKDVYCLSQSYPLPFCLVEVPSDRHSGIWMVLEGLKELLRRGSLSRTEYDRMKNALVD